MIVLNHPQGSQDWLQARVGACTASRFSEARERVGLLTEQQAKYIESIRGGMPEASARAVAGYKAAPRSAIITKALAGEPTDAPSAAAIKYAWLIALETIARKPLDDTFTTYAMNRGRELEPIARSVYEARTKCWVEEVSLILTDDGRFGYSADGFRDDDGLIEIKCPTAADKIGNVWATPEEAHLEYLDQIMGGLWITGRKYCDLVIYCDWLKPVGKDLFVKRIYRDEAYIEALELGLVNFMRMVDGFLEVLRAPAKMSGAAIAADAHDGGDVVPAPWADAASAHPTQPTTPVPEPARVASPAALITDDIFG